MANVDLPSSIGFKSTARRYETSSRRSDLGRLQSSQGHYSKRQYRLHEHLGKNCGVYARCLSQNKPSKYLNLAKNDLITLPHRASGGVGANPLVRDPAAHRVETSALTGGKGSSDLERSEAEDLSSRDRSMAAPTPPSDLINLNEHSLSGRFGHL
jgi:hypothetical protein